jgi:hypothetical protein
MTLMLLLGFLLVPFQVAVLFTGEFSGLSLIAIVAMAWPVLSLCSTSCVGCSSGRRIRRIRRSC